MKFAIKKFPAGEESLYRDFQREIKALSIERVRITCILCIVLFLLGGWLDYGVFPEKFQVLFLLRVACSIIEGFILYLTFTGFGKSHSTLLGILAYLIIGFVISGMADFTGGHASPYYAGLNLVILGMSVLMPWGVEESLLVGSLLYFSYIGPILLLTHISNKAIFINNNFFLLCTICISLTATFFGHRFRFHEYKSRVRLEATKNSLVSAYEKLKGLDQAKTEFFANVSHELRTPLTLILLPLEMALNKEFGELSPDLQKGLTTVKTNGLRLLNLINGLLDLAKTDAGKMELFKNKYDLNLLVQGILSSLSLIADKKNIQLSYEARTAIPEFYFDREKIERVFINIISNALKFTDAEGTISVTLAMKGEVVEARVKDSGIGIPEKSLEKIFERFTQVDSSSSRKYQGTGLGLALCKEFLELHGGAIRAESKLGEGSTFILTLPLILSVKEIADPVDRRVRDFETKVKRRNEDLTKTLSISALYESTDFENSENDSIIKNETGEERYKILIVEDNSQMREYIGSILKRDYTVITAQNGVEGLEKVKNYPPDLVVSDLMMPLKDGYQLCKELKSAPESRHIPVILLTAKSELSNKIEGFELGANEYLSKPFNASELLARVKSLLQLKELEKENIQSRKMAAMAVMVAGVIHEINNPICFTKTSWSAISESFEKLKTIIQVPELKPKEEEISKLVSSTDSALDIVHKGIERIQTVINRLKVFDGRQSLNFESLQLNQLLDQLVTRIQEGFTKAQKEGIQIHKEYQLGEPIEGIPVLLTQTFEVMIDNAVKAVRLPGLITIKTWQGSEGNVFVSIRDNGCGVKKEKLDHLFEPFFTLRDVGSGMGLGLFLAHQVIQSHHGSIIVNSAEHRGTEMIIQLPVIQPQSNYNFPQHPYQSTR